MRRSDAEWYGPVIKAFRRKWKGEPMKKWPKRVWAVFWMNVERNGTGCWNWTAYTHPTGYGKFTVGLPYFEKKRTVVAHRAAWEFMNGEIPTGLCLDHLCRNRRCVNPDHLEAVTLKENILRGVGPSARQARQVVCKRGHSLSGSNLSVHGGKRSCKACMKKTNAAWRESNREYINEKQRDRRHREKAMAA